MSDRPPNELRSMAQEDYNSDTSPWFLTIVTGFILTASSLFALLLGGVLWAAHTYGPFAAAAGVLCLGISLMLVGARGVDDE